MMITAEKLSIFKQHRLLIWSEVVGNGSLMLRTSWFLRLIIAHNIIVFNAGLKAITNNGTIDYLRIRSSLISLLLQIGVHAAAVLGVSGYTERSDVMSSC